MKTVTWILTIALILSFLYCCYDVSTFFGYTFKDFPNYSWISLLISFVAWVLWAIIKILIEKRKLIKSI